MGFALRAYLGLSHDVKGNAAQSRLQGILSTLDPCSTGGFSWFFYFFDQDVCLPAEGFDALQEGPPEDPEIHEVEGVAD